MRRLLLFLLVLMAVAIFLYRQRLFLRDPLGRVEINGTRQQDAKVFINYSNDVLILSGGALSAVIVQGWDRTPGHPKQLSCVREMACLMPNDHAPKEPLGQGSDQASVSMGDREVRYRSQEGDWVRVVIR